jgi:hypothetical protein
MGKIKLLALVSVAAMLFACGTQDEEKSDVNLPLPVPACLKNTDYAFVSPFDIFVAEFDSVITDLDKLDGKNIITSPDIIFMLPKGKTEGNKLYFMGTNTTTQGYHYFKANRSYSIEFKNLKNSNGLITNAKLNFITQWILDNVKSENDDEEASAGDIHTVDAVNNTLDDRGGKVEFAGILEHKYSSGNRYNMRDWYKINLIGRDSIKIKVDAFNYITETLVGTDPVSGETIEYEPGTFSDTIGIELIGPGGKKSWTARKGMINEFPSPILSYYISGDVHYMLGETIGSPIQFHLKIFDDALNAKPNPYTISITVSKTK